MQDIKVFKLVSGETIVAKATLAESHVKVEEPIQFTVVSRGGYGNMVASEWMHTEQTSFKLRRDHIVAMAQPTDMLLSYYHNTIEQLNQPEETEEEYIERMAIDSFIANTGMVTIH